MGLESSLKLDNCKICIFWEKLRSSLFAEGRITPQVDTHHEQMVYAEATLAAQSEVVGRMISAIEQADVAAVGAAMEKVEEALRSMLRDEAPGKTAAVSRDKA